MQKVKTLTFPMLVEERDNLKHHAERTRIPMVNIVRQAIRNHLRLLDEEEVAEKRLKAEKKLVPSLPKYSGRVPDAAPSPFSSEAMAKKRADDKAKAASKKAEKEVPDNVKRSFRRWAEYIEAAEDRSDAKSRADDVLKDLREKCSSEEQVEAYYEVFMDLLRSRRAAKEAVIEVKKVVGEIDD